jgi:hypothetical protein
MMMMRRMGVSIVMMDEGGGGGGEGGAAGRRARARNRERVGRLGPIWRASEVNLVVWVLLVKHGASSVKKVR